MEAWLILIALLLIWWFMHNSIDLPNGYMVIYCRRHLRGKPNLRIGLGEGRFAVFPLISRFIRRPKEKTLLVLPVSVHRTTTVDETSFETASPGTNLLLSYDFSWRVTGIDILEGPLWPHYGTDPLLIEPQIDRWIHGKLQTWAKALTKTGETKKEDMEHIMASLSNGSQSTAWVVRDVKLIGARIVRRIK